VDLKSARNLRDGEQLDSPARVLVAQELENPAGDRVDQPRVNGQSRYILNGVCRIPGRVQVHVFRAAHVVADWG
jgi:hypothetical protein